MSLASVRARAAASTCVVQSEAVLGCTQMGRSGAQGVCRSVPPRGSTSSCLPLRPWCLLFPTSPREGPQKAGMQGPRQKAPRKAVALAPLSGPAALPSWGQEQLGPC